MIKKFNKYFIVFILLGLILSIDLSAQLLHIKNYTTNDGLPSSQVWCSLQDSKGYIWFGTSNGLVKYNGQEFVTYKVSDGLVSSVVLSLLEDRGKIWITTDNGISCYDGENFTNYILHDSLNFGIVWCVAKFQDCLWFGTKRLGLFKFDLEKNRDGNNIFTNYSEKDELPLSSIFSFATGNKYLWIAYADSGLYRYDGNDFVDYTKKFNLQNKVLTNLIIIDSTLWVGTATNGLFRCNLKSEFEKLDISKKVINYFPDDYIYSSSAKGKSLLFGTRGNGLIYKKDKFIRYTAENGLINNLVYSILVDKENSIWLTTNNGITKILSDKFFGYMKNETILSVCEYKGAIWLGTFENGLKRLDGNKITNYTTKDGLLSNNQIMTLTVFNDQLWIGSWGGLNSYDGKNFKQYSEKDEIYKVPVLTLLPVKNSLWIGTVNRVWKYQPHKFKNKFTLYSTEDGLTNTYFQSVAQDNKRIWFGTPGGAFCYDPDRSGEKFIKLSTNDGLSADCINTIFKDFNGTLWFGTTNGLNKYDPDKTETEKKFVLYNTEDGLSDNNIVSITQAGKYLWIATSNGLNKFDGEKVIKVYDRKNGLLGNEFPSYNSLFRDSKNHIWFCTYNGITEYLPENDIPNIVPPPVYIEKFSMNDSLITVRKNPEFEYHQNTAKFSYIGLSFKDEDDVRYKYKLKGYDKEWSEVTQKTQVRYTNLNNGNYTFTVLAQNGDGYWSETPAELSFKILPPFWKTWWFILIELFIIGLIIYGIFLLKTAQLRHRAKVLEQKVNERTAQLRETQKMLVDTAHRAGMAEIATGILHNVGNILNSVKVSSQILKEKIKSSKVNNLQKVLDLMEEHTDNIGEFITSDEKGKMLPEYLIKVGTTLKDEQDNSLKELSNLHKGINHIEEIIAVQQSYAGVSGLIEKVALSEMMDDVLKMHSEMFRKYKIKIIKNYSKTKPILIEKGKLIQVFVNLLKNAIESLETIDEMNRVITINILEDKQHQTVEMTDNGAGISKDNLTKIFSYGFSTKKGGKGFGLHTGALAMTEMKGKLIAQSDGEEKGAKFTVIVPKKK